MKTYSKAFAASRSENFESARDSNLRPSPKNYDSERFNHCAIAATVTENNSFVSIIDDKKKLISIHLDTRTAP